MARKANLTSIPDDDPGSPQYEARLLSWLIWLLTGTALVVAMTSAALARLRFAHAADFLVLCLESIGPILALRAYASWRGLDRRLPLLMDIVATYFIIAFALVVAQEAAATVRAPDATALVERIDGVFGFHWFNYAYIVSEDAPLCRLLEICYRGWIAEFVVAMAALVYYAKFKAIGEFTVAYMLTSFATVAIFACLDVRSLESVAAYGLPHFHHPSGAGPHYLEGVKALRSGLNRTLNFDRIQAFVSFPSLHGASALLLAAATRELKGWRYGFLAFNVLVLVSTLSEGGHDLTDVIAGAALACVSLSVSTRLYSAISRRALRARFARSEPIAAIAYSG